MSNAATIAGWAGVLAGLAGIIASGFLVRAGKRNDDTENALAVAQDLADLATRSPPATESANDAERTVRDFRPVIVDLNREIVTNDKDNRADTRTGAWLLGAAFVLLIIQSVALIVAGTNG